MKAHCKLHQVLLFGLLLFAAPIFSQSSSMQQLDEWIKSRPYKPGDDGFVSVVNPANVPATVYPKFRFIYVNGILNTYPDARNNAQMAANEIGQPVVFVYSKSLLQSEHNLPASVAGDLYQAVAYRLGAGTDAVHALESLTFSQLWEGNTVRILAHSRGAAVAYNAAIDLKSNLQLNERAHLLDNLEIITLGGYSPPSEKWSEGLKVLDIVNQYDLVPWLAGNGAPGSELSNLSIDKHPFKEYLPWLEKLGLKDLGKEVLDIKSFDSMTPPQGFPLKLEFEGAEIVGRIPKFAGDYECVDCPGPLAKPGTYNQEIPMGGTYTTILSPISFLLGGNTLSIQSEMRTKSSGHQTDTHTYSPTEAVMSTFGSGTLNGDEAILNMTMTTTRVRELNITRHKPYSNDPTLRSFELDMDNVLIGTMNQVKALPTPPILQQAKVKLLPDGSIQFTSLTGEGAGKVHIYRRIK